MVRRKLFHNRTDHRGYVNRLMKLSSMPDKEKNRWDKVMPTMNDDELYQFQGILENEIRDLADVYLKVLQRKLESRSFSVENEIAGQTFYKAPTADEYEATPVISDADMTPEDEAIATDKEISILQKLLYGAPFIPESKKNAMLEVSQHMPLKVLRDLQEVVIREGLRALKKNLFKHYEKGKQSFTKSINNATL